jgi:hypothetical protein
MEPLQRWIEKRKNLPELSVKIIFMKLYHIWFRLIVLLIPGSLLHAQDCAQALRLARAIYDQGRLQEVETYLQPCLSGNTSGNQKALMVEAYKLLCLSHIYLEEPEKADADMLNIKKTDPYYQPNAGVDPAEYVALYNTFRQAPVFRYGGRMGVNAAKPMVQSVNSTVPLASGSSYQYGFSFYFGLGADLPLSETITLHADLLLNPNRFTLKENVRIYDPFTGQQRLNQFRGTETQNWLTLPVQAEYSLFRIAAAKDKTLFKLSPYVGLGASVSYLLSANMGVERQRQDQSAVPEATVAVNRNRINAGIQLAAGIKPRIGSGKLGIEIRYTYGLTRITSQEKAYENQRLLADYYYVDPIYRIGTFSLSIMYLQDKFSPKKLIRNKT